MTLIYWQWGDILTDSLQEEFQESTIEITPDAGVPFKRQRFTDAVEIIQATFTLTRTEYLDFISWYKFNIQQGSLSFQYYDTRYNVYKTTKMIGKPSISSNSNMFNVTMQIAFVDDGGA